MIKVLKPNNNKITCLVSDRHALEKVVKGYVDNICDSKLFLSSDNKEILINILKRMIVKSIDETIIIEENCGYIVEITLDTELLKFSLTKLNNEKFGKGYSIALTLQG